MTTSGGKKKREPKRKRLFEDVVSVPQPLKSIDFGDPSANIVRICDFVNRVKSLVELSSKPGFRVSKSNRHLLTHLSEAVGELDALLRAGLNDETIRAISASLIAAKTHEHISANRLSYYVEEGSAFLRRQARLPRKKRKTTDDRVLAIGKGLLRKGIKPRNVTKKVSDQLDADGQGMKLTDIRKILEPILKPELG